MSRQQVIDAIKNLTPEERRELKSGTRLFIYSGGNAKVSNFPGNNPGDYIIGVEIGSSKVTHILVTGGGKTNIITVHDVPDI